MTDNCINCFVYVVTSTVRHMRRHVTLAKIANLAGLQNLALEFCWAKARL